MPDGFDPSLPSEEPFIFIERRSTVGRLEVISYGAWGKLTGHDTRRGGVAVVDKQTRDVLAVLVIAGSPAKRDDEHTSLARADSENRVLTLVHGRHYFMPWEG
jgi:hypothetical protein